MYCYKRPANKKSDKTLKKQTRRCQPPNSILHIKFGSRTRYVGPTHANKNTISDYVIQSENSEKPNMFVLLKKYRS